MNTLQAHGLLNTALETMQAWNTESTRATVLELMDKYNELAAANPRIYRQIKNASDHDTSVWIVAT